MTYDAPTMVEADLVKEVGIMTTTNLEASGELDRADVLKAAHNAIYQELESRGIDPTKLTNDTRLKSAIGWEWCLRLAAHGYLDQGVGDRQAAMTHYRELRDEAIRRFVPKYTSEDAPRVEGIPAVANYEDGWDYGPTPGARTTQKYRDAIPKED